MKLTTPLRVAFIAIILNSCVQKTHLKTIQLKLDMTNVENPSDVGLRGEFGSNPWNETVYLADDDGDGIYEGSITKQTGQGSIEFKFVNHHEEFELQGQNNRFIIFKYHPETLIYEAVFNNTTANIISSN
jgi:hypothetical protein